MNEAFIEKNVGCLDSVCAAEHEDSHGALFGSSAHFLGWVGRRNILRGQGCREEQTRDRYKIFVIVLSYVDLGMGSTRENI